MATLAFCVLGSGSGGNCTAIVLDPDGPGLIPPRVLLLDAGLSPKSTRRRLGEVGLRFADVTDILLTHLDSDHLHPSWPAALFHNDRIHVHVHARHEPALRETTINERRLCVIEDQPSPSAEEGSRGDAEARSGIKAGETQLLFSAPPRLGAECRDATPSSSPTFTGSTRVTAVSLPHDELGATAYVLEHEGTRLGLATDLGHVPPGLVDAFAELDALAFESNYDTSMQLASQRPEFLKRRIMGGRGHLSNEQALEAIVEIDRRGRLQHVALLHLSRQCNDPALVRRLYAERAPHVLPRLVLSRQDVPTAVLRVAGRTAGGCEQGE